MPYDADPEVIPFRMTADMNSIAVPDYSDFFEEIKRYEDGFYGETPKYYGETYENTIFLEAGAKVTGSYRRMKPELEQLAQDVELFSLDTDDRDGISGVLKERIRSFGGIDVLVNCIGITHPQPLYAADPAAWEKVLETNLFCAMRILQACIIPLISRKNGSVINISSVFGSVGGVGQSSYCASKAALDAMTRAAALELAVKKIRVNTVAPGFIETEMTAGFDEAFRKSSIESVPLKRFGKPEEVAALCEFLASDEAQYITGQTFVIDGGLLAQ